MKDEDLEILTSRLFNITWRFGKWYVFQYILLLLTPYIWYNNIGKGLVILIAIYTLLYSIYWELLKSRKRIQYIYIPFFLYVILSIMCCISWSEVFPSIFLSISIPTYGVFCVFLVKIIKKYIRKRTNSISKKMVVITVIIVSIILLKTICVLWGCKSQGSLETEKKEIIQRRDYLLEKNITTPSNVLSTIPSGIGEQFQGEWALYSCSMLSAALTNISNLYPETREDNLMYIDRLINIVMSPELRKYDMIRWSEDPLNSLEGNNSHVSYLSHLAWMISGYKKIGGNDKYDKLFSSLCECMNRRLLQSPGLNLATYPGEPIYVPDMLVAIVALQQYSELNNGKYGSTVKQWLANAKKRWCDKETGLLVSFLEENGDQIKNAPIKGSYSALNCYYLTLIDKTFALDQYIKLKQHFWKDSIVSGLKEYHNKRCYIGIDIDAGPIIFELSPSGTAFAIGSASYFKDHDIRKKILRTAEIAGHSIIWDNKRHYLLANVALVGESIMLAMRTNLEMRK